MDEFYCRLMGVDDVSEVARLEESIFSMPWSAKSIESAQENDDNIYIVCVKSIASMTEDLKESVVGYIGIWGSFDEGEITNVAIDSEYRRKGLARKMLEYSFDVSKKRGIERLILEVRESNEPARRLYLGLGFEELGVRKNFYEKPVENAVIMGRTI